MAEYQVAILGAGVAGLSAARVLSGAGVRAVVIEARDRVGGRIHTVRDARLPLPVELGAEFVHGLPPETWSLLAEAKLAAYELPDEHRVLRGRRLVKEEHFWEDMEKLLRKVRSAVRRGDVPFAEFMARPEVRRQPKARRDLVMMYVEGFNAADARLLSAKSVVEAEDAAQEIHGDRSFKLAGGYAALPEWLFSRLDRGRVEVRLGAVVRRVRWGPGGCGIEADAMGETMDVTADRVIVALPLGVLKVPFGQLGAIEFDPEVPAIRRAAGGLEMGPVVKAVLAFDRVFWPDDLSFMHARGSAFPTWWSARPFRTPVLTGWAGGPAAEALAGKGEDEIFEAAVTSLAQYLSLTKATLRKRVVARHIYDWESDPFTRGAYSYVRAGALDAIKTFERPVRRRLFFAGEHAHEGMSGTVAGAIASGMRAAKQVLSGDSR